MSKKVGLDCYFYYCTTELGDANLPGDATWVEIGAIRDASVSGEVGSADVTSRGNRSRRAHRPTLIDDALDLTAMWDPDDAGLLALQTARLNRTAVAIAMMDGDIEVAGSRGIVGNFYVTKFGRNEALDQGVEVAITMVHSSEGEEYTVTGS